MTTITRLEAQNVMRLSAVRIEANETGLVVIAGKNAAGKTSVLDSIAMALGGKNLMPEQPLRKGAKSGEIKVTLSNGLVIIRTLTGDRTTNLRVESEDGGLFQSPQRMLDALVSELSFDPMTFMQAGEAGQVAMLKNLIPADLDAIERRRHLLYTERTEANREVKRQQARLSDFQQHDGVPDEEVSIGALTAQLEGAQESHRENRQAIEKAGQLQIDAGRRLIQAQDIRSKIIELDAEAQNLEDSASELDESAIRTLGELEHVDLPDLDAITGQIQGLEETNREVRENREHATCTQAIESGTEETSALTEQIDACDAERSDAFAKANLPVEGLTVEDGSVHLNDLPLSQSSQAERLQVSVALGIALNPELRVLLVRDGNDLDDDSIKAVAEMAESAKAQLWIEMVRPGDLPAILIEDGAYGVDEEQA